MRSHIQIDIVYNSSYQEVARIPVSQTFNCEGRGCHILEPVHLAAEHGGPISMTANFLSATAIVISIIALLSQYRQYKKSDAQVSVRGRITTIIFPDQERRHCLTLLAINSGRSSTTIQDWGFMDPDNRFTIGPRSSRWHHGPDLHTVISPEDPRKFWCLDIQEQREALNRRDPGGSHLLRAFVILGSSTDPIVEKKVIALEGPPPPASSLAERWKASRRSGIFPLVIQKEGEPDLYLRLESTGPAAAKGIIVDVIHVNDGGQRPREVFRRRYMRKGRIAMIRTPDWAYGADTSFRILTKGRPPLESWHEIGVHPNFH
jgi:hypothetical protein